MEIGTIVVRANERLDSAGEIIEITGDKATVKWVWPEIKTKVKLSSLKPYVERTEKEKILAQIETNNRQMNKRDCAPRLFAYLKKENAELQAKI